MTDPDRNAAEPGAQHYDPASEHGMSVYNLKIMAAKQAEQVPYKKKVVVRRFPESVDDTAERLKCFLVNSLVLVKDKIMVFKLFCITMERNGLGNFFGTACFQGTAKDENFSLHLEHLLMLRYFQYRYRIQPGTKQRGVSILCWLVFTI